MGRHAALEQVEGFVSTTVFQRHLAQREVHLVQKLLVLGVLQHVFQQLHNGLAVSVAALVGHGLLNVPLEHPLVIRPAHVGHLLELPDGPLLVPCRAKALRQDERDAGALLVLLAHPRKCVLQMACGLFKLLCQNAILRQDKKGVHHGFVRSVSDAFSFGQGVLGFDVVPGTHVRSPQPRVGPRLGVVAIHRARQVGEDLLRLGVVSLQVIRLANDGVVVVDPLVHDRPAERLGHPLGWGHGVAVHHTRAFLDGPLHQWENLLGAFLVRLQEQG